MAFYNSSSLPDSNNVKTEGSPDNPPEASSLTDPASDLPLSLDDKTKIMDINSSAVKMSAYMKVSNDTDNIRDIFKLEEDQSEWILGRDETADIIVDNPNISRNHCKITKQGPDYFIEDLKSSNGTILNDKELKPGKPYAVQSGDMIYILDIEILFEIKNLSLEKALSQMKAPPPALKPATDGLLPVAPHPVSGWPGVGAPLPAEAPGVIVEMPEESSSPLGFLKQNKKRFIMYGAVLSVVLGGLLLSTEEKPTEKEGEENETVVAGGGELAGLSPEQVNWIENTYKIARLSFSQGKFDLCSSEIKKIYKYTDSYQDSKKLEIACTQALENQKRQHDLEYKRKKATATDELIQKVTDQCREKFSTFQFKYELVACLNRAIELSPADGRIQALIDQFETNEALKAEQQRQREKRRQFIKSISSKYHYAKSLHQKGKTLKAMSAYQHFINISGHRELKQQQAKAKRELASIKQAFQDKNNRLEESCKNPFNAGQFQKAYYACDKAADKIPEPHNKKSIQLRDKAQNKLEVVMKPLYEEANLNESVGNVAIAQEHWKKILQLDVKTGLYYKRAKAKLNKY